MDDSSLIGFIEQISGEVQLRVEENLGDGYVRLRIAEAERRQAKHDIRHVEDIVIEMLRNARDAHAGSVYIASAKEEHNRRLTFIDDGDGIPEHMHALVFDPRVTSKLDTLVMDNWGVHGRGMALYSIKSNVKEAHVCESQPGAGTSITVLVNTEELPERSDQSTLPALEKDEQGVIHVARGPHNIARNAIEFVLAQRASSSSQGGSSGAGRNFSIYMGSPSEVVATLLDNGQRHIPKETLLFCSDPSTLPICDRLAIAGDAAELVDASARLGLHISERTAHRVISGQIPPLRPLLDLVLPRRVAVAVRSIDLTKDTRGLKLSKDDIQTFSRALESAFEPLAKQYYLSLTKEPKISVKGDTITVRFPFEKEL